MNSVRAGIIDHPNAGMWDGKYQWLTVFALTLVALITRIWGIGEWGVISDEYYTITRASERAFGFQQPAYYALLLLFTEILGDTPFAARIPAALLGALAVPVFYFTFRNLIGGKAALLGCFFIILSGWHLHHSQLSRFYSAVFLFGITSYYFYFESLRKNSLKWFILALGSMVLGILFHATALLVPLTCGLFSVWVWFSSKSDSFGLSKRIGRINVISFGVLGLGLIPLVLKVIERWTKGDGGGAGSSAISLTEPVSTLFQFVQHVEPLFLIAAFMGLLVLYQKDRALSYLFALGILGQLAILLLLALLLPPVRAKYIISIYPLLIAATAYFCTYCSTQMQSHRHFIIRNGVTILLLFSMIIGFLSYYAGKRSLDIKQPVNFIKNNYTPDDDIIGFSHALIYHLEKDFSDENIHIYGGRAVWRKALKPYEENDENAWIILDLYRSQSFDTQLYKWLTENAQLVWRKNEKRFDYSMQGWEVYRIKKDDSMVISLDSASTVIEE